MIDFIRMQPGDRMVRIGFGQHTGRWFARIDLWWFGVRVSR